MKRTESKTSHSSLWDSHVRLKNSKWLQENVEEMDQHVRRMLKLIEDDADSFTKKAESYFTKRPELIALVEDLYRTYRLLAERYNHLTRELQKNISTDLQSQGSGISDIGSEPQSSTMPSPEPRPSCTKSGPRAAGFHFFLGSDKSGSSDLNSKIGDESWTLDSESESDDSSVNNYPITKSNGDELGLRRRVSELESELRDVKEKFRLDYGSSEVSSKIGAYEEESRVAKENIRRSEEKISMLTLELQKYKSLGEPNNNKNAHLHSKHIEIEQNQGSNILDLQDKLKSAQKEIPVWKNKLEKEKREVSRLLDRITRYKNNLSDREQEIRGLKEAMNNANESLSEENEQLKTEMTRMARERTYLEDNLKESDLRSRFFEDDVRRVKAAKAEMEIALGNQIEHLKAGCDDLAEELKKMMEDSKMKDDQIAEMKKHIEQLRMQHAELIADADVARKSAEELGFRVEELELEVERKQETIFEGAEEKREAIRQLCFSIEHYRVGYCELRQAVMAHKRPAVMAT